jgi:adenylate cyclase
MAGIHRLLKLDPPSLRRADVAAMSGVPREESLRWWRAMGFPEVPEDEPAFSAQDVDMVRRLHTLLDADLVDDDDVLRLARLMGASFSRIADAQLAVIDEHLASQQARPEETRQERLSAMLLGADTDALDFIEHSMLYVWRRHLLTALSHWLSIEEDDTEQAVGFADLSGFSRVSKKVSRAELTDIIENFETAAFDVVSAHDGRIVKLIGDEVMFVTPTIDEALAISLDLMSRLEPIDLVPPIHCGLAHGPSVTVGGDVFGPTVNLASRLTEVARADSIAMPLDVGRHLLDRDDLDVRRVHRAYDLKGVGRTQILVVRAPRPRSPEPD